MNGAESLVRTLLASGIDTCFANPGTSEMHFVAALDQVDGMRCVLGLFEGVVTGAADGYARMAGKPAATLLHLGPGLANGLANLHNAAKADTPVVNIVGDHATYHRRYDSPLTSDIETAARPFSAWVRTSAGDVAADGAAAIAAAQAGGVATLILPADTAWSPGPPVVVAPVPTPPAVDIDVAAGARALGDGPAMLLLGGKALSARGLDLAAGIAARTGARLLAETFNARMARGRNVAGIERLPYPMPLSLAALAGLRHLVLVGARAPVAFFAYPGRPSVLTEDQTVITDLAGDPLAVLERLAERVGTGDLPPPPILAPPATGAITPAALAQSIAALLPDNAIVVDEGLTAGVPVYGATTGAAPHDWLQNMGGSIGWGLPAALGAAIASPGRRVVAIQADGSGMYTLQALWTMAREACDVTVVVLANRAYAVLHHELANVGAGQAGPKAHGMISLDRPDLDWCHLARGMGVPAAAAGDMDDFNRRFAAANATPGPSLIEVRL